MSMLEFVEVKNEAGDERVARLAKWIWRDHYGAILGDGQIGYMLDKFQSAAAVGKQRSEGYRYFLVRDSGAPIGYFGAKPDGENYFLSKLYLVKPARGKGVGKTCLSYIEELARAAGCKAVTLTVNKHNAGSIAVYEHLGFTVYGDGVVDIGGGYVMDDFYMKKELQ